MYSENENQALEPYELREGATDAEVHIHTHETNDKDNELEDPNNVNTQKHWFEEGLERTLEGLNGSNRMYEKVSVLLLQWVEGLHEPETASETEDLRQVFSENFNYHCELRELNVESSPHQQLQHHLSSFIATFDGPDNLLIVYYNGYALYDGYGDHLELAPSLDSSHRSESTFEARANWILGGETALCYDFIEGDVLSIIGADYYSSHLDTGKRADVLNHAGAFEQLSGGAIDDTNPTPDTNSFTRACIDSLRKFSDEYIDRTFTIFDLKWRIDSHPARQGKSSQLHCRRGSHWQSIRLAPLGKDSLLKDSRPPGSAPKGYLDLGFALRDRHLTRSQIDVLARKVSFAVARNKSLIGLRGIEWLGVERMPGSKVPTGSARWVALATFWFKKWKEIVEKSREQRESRPFPTSGDTATMSTGLSLERKRGRLSEAGEVLPGPKRRLLVVQFTPEDTL